MVQVLALQSMLARERIDGRICLGVRRELAGEPLAHAWLCCGDTIVIGAGAQPRYKVLATYCWGAAQAPSPADPVPGDVAPNAEQAGAQCTGN